MAKRPNPELIDDENPEWTDADFAHARPASEVLPEIFPPEIVAEMLKPRGRPRMPQTKVHLNLRLSPEVVEYFKTTGPGWQTRVDEVLKDWVKTHPQ